ncbi:hypothetical protein J2741_001719 [Methanolinea mesophila]|uniref:hypothetical protein n=1 Tax=Methanolinea mesophila TaxID=547055 RepID=UPI001AE4B45E|nr:hypothetical protein [Methanolinea mesophila]MBP1929172.1 hypothetical protein [Methanolinea mesophila]
MFKRSDGEIGGVDATQMPGITRMNSVVSMKNPTRPERTGTLREDHIIIYDTICGKDRFFGSPVLSGTGLRVLSWVVRYPHEIKDDLNTRTQSADKFKINQKTHLTWRDPDIYFSGRSST